MIKVDEEFYIDADNMSWQVLKRAFNEKKNEYYFQNVCYPSSLKGCIEWIMRIKQRNAVEEKDMDLKQALIEMQKINDEMNDILNEIGEKEKL